MFEQEAMFFFGPRGPLQLLRAQPHCPGPGHGQKHTAGKRRPASSPTRRAASSGPKSTAWGRGACVVIPRDLHVCLCSTTTKRRVATYSSSVACKVVGSSRRVPLAPWLLAAWQHKCQCQRACLRIGLLTKHTRLFFALRRPCAAPTSLSPSASRSHQPLAECFSPPGCLAA